MPHSNPVGSESRRRANKASSASGSGLAGGWSPVRGSIANYLLPALLLIGFVHLSLTGMVQRSATFDEPVYITAGYCYWVTGDYRLKPDAPPLVGLLSGGALRAAELLGLPIKLPLEDPLWDAILRDQRQEYGFADAFFTANQQQTFYLLQAARLPIVAIGVVLGIVLFRWGCRLFGVAGGTLALLLYALDPNLVAHATIVSADLPLAAAFLATHYYFYRFVSEPGYSTLPMLCFWFAVTLGVKFTGLLVIPSLGLIGLACCLWPAKEFVAAQGGNPAKYRALILRKGCWAIVACLTASLVFLSVIYQRWDAVGAYYRGIRSIYTNLTPGYEHYLLGEFQPGTWPYYYLVAVLVKTPETTLVLLLLALLPWRAGGIRASYPWHKLLFLLVPLCLVHLVSSFDQTNIGLRRVLLTYPFLFLLAGRLGEAWRSPTPVWNGLHYSAPRLATLALAALFHVAIAWSIHPYQLAYFNASSGGPVAGPNYLDDSNIDWGQDLPSLASYLEEQGITEVRYSLFSIEPMERYGITGHPITYEEEKEPHSAVYVISAHHLIRMRLGAQLSGDWRLDWLSRFEPAERVGYSIYVYDFRNSTTSGR